METIEEVNRIITIIASGRHHFLCRNGPKVTFSRAVHDAFPVLTKSESIECAKIFGSVGMEFHNIVGGGKTNFRAPHHTCNVLALTGTTNRIGEVHSAHNGVILFDETNLFHTKSIIEVIKIVKSRVSVFISYELKKAFIQPVNVLMVVTDMKLFESNANGPQSSEVLEDVIDIKVDASYKNELVPGRNQNEMSEIRKITRRVREKQKKRYSGTQFMFNSEIDTIDMVSFTKSGRDHISGIQHYHKLSNIETLKIARVARTIADISSSSKVNSDHISESFNIVIGYDFLGKINEINEM